MTKEIVKSKQASTSFMERRKLDRRQNVKPYVMTASLMTHIMVDLKTQKPLSSAPLNTSTETYKKGAKIMQKRVPVGWQQEISA